MKRVFLRHNYGNKEIELHNFIETSNKRTPLKSESLRGGKRARMFQLSGSVVHMFVCGAGE